MIALIISPARGATNSSLHHPPGGGDSFRNCCNRSCSSRCRDAASRGYDCSASCLHLSYISVVAPGGFPMILFQTRPLVQVIISSDCTDKCHSRCSIPVKGKWPW